VNASTKQFVMSARRRVAVPTRTQLVEGLRAIPGVEIIGTSEPAVTIQADEAGLRRVLEAYGSTHRVEEELKHKPAGKFRF
jgi:hypothetical protein